LNPTEALGLNGERWVAPLDRTLAIALGISIVSACSGFSGSAKSVDCSARCEADIESFECFFDDFAVYQLAKRESFILHHRIAEELK